MTDIEIQAVDDTARWVAHQRAQESARPDALFNDHLAERLAGARGREIAAMAAAATAAAGGDGWYLTTRTVLLDRVVTASVADGFDTVINLGAGLDARPYRLELPADLTWVEVDLPELIGEKEALLAHERPRCRLRRVPLDLGRDELTTMLHDASRGRTLVLAEGLIMYLSPGEVDALSADLVNAGITRWSFDLSTAGVGTLVAERNRTLLASAPWRFLPADGVAYFEKRGWAVERIEPIFPAAVALGRLDTPEARRAAAGPQPDPRAPGDVPYSAVVTVTPDR